MSKPILSFTLLLLIPTFFHIVSSSTFTFSNKCSYTVWPGLLSSAGTTPLPTTGFSLSPSQSRSLPIPSSWSGRIWARTLCSTNSSTSHFSCLTADCGSNSLQCSGSGAIPPATLAEFTLNGANGLDFYDVSLVDGYNLPILVQPSGGKGDNCTWTGCAVDLNGECPTEMKVLNEDGKMNVACKSACEAFGDARYCCTGEYGSPDTCKPSQYSIMFKSACPRAYSYAYDDKSSTFTCGGSPDYVITFCPSPNTSQKASTGTTSNTTTTTANTTTTTANTTPSEEQTREDMVYGGLLDSGSATWSRASGGVILMGIASYLLY